MLDLLGFLFLGTRYVTRDKQRKLLKFRRGCCKVGNGNGFGQKEHFLLSSRDGNYFILALLKKESGDVMLESENRFSQKIITAGSNLISDFQ